MQETDSISVPSGTVRKRGRPAGAKDSYKRSKVTNQQRAMLTTDRGKALLSEGQDAMRERLIGQNHISRLEVIQQQLQAGAQSDALTATQIQALGKSADISLRLLAKVLPDLKSMEVTRKAGELLTIDQVPERQRHAIAAAIEEALGMGGQGGMGDSVENSNAPTPRQQILENEILGLADTDAGGLNEDLQG